jgi:O-antigen/teichoic acid export membrane protein
MHTAQSPDIQHNPPPESSDKKADLTGRDRFVSNLIHSWGGYILIIIAGFIMPRLMNRYVGQFNLGIWDFAWSFVSYLSLARLDIGSAINRYVAKYRSEGNNEKISVLISTVIILQLATAIIVLIGTVLVIYWLPALFANRLGEQTTTAQWVVALLGLSLAIRMANGSSSAIMTGCHRWDTHNTITVTSRFIEISLMWVALVYGVGLKGLAVILLCVGIGTEWQRLRISRKICPNLDVKLSKFSWKMSREVIRFGLKTLLFDFPPLYLVQTTNMVIANQLGPAQLAVFARSIALVRHVETFSSKFSSILSPMAGSLQAMKRQEELRQFFLDTSQYGVAFATPIIVFLFVNGDAVLRLWMGDQYVIGTPLAILAAGYLLPTAQNSVREILKGLNLHGKIGIATLLISAIFFAIGLIAIKFFSCTLTTAALLIAIPLAMSLGITPAIFACKRLQIRYSEYCRHTLFVPFLANLLFGLCLLGGRSYADNIWYGVLTGSIIGAFILFFFYYRYILPTEFKNKLLNKLLRSSRN